MTDDTNFEAAGFWAQAAMSTQMSPAEKELRDKFVDEYLFDFSQTYAAVRLGFNLSFATEYATRFMAEPYVRQQIAIKQKAMADDPKHEAEETKRRIRAAMLKEAHYKGPGASHAARVSALTKLGHFYGMEAPVKTLNEHLHRGGVMQVPEIADVEKWEDAAQASQEALRKASEV